MSRGSSRGAGLSLAQQVVQALRPARGYFMMETYGPDGEIEEASECWPLTEEYLASGAVQAVRLLRPDAEGRHPAPKADWPQRGVIPPQGFHRYQGRTP